MQTIWVINKWDRDLISSEAVSTESKLFKNWGGGGGAVKIHLN